MILALLKKDRQLFARISPSHISLAIADLLASVFWLPFLVTDIYIVDKWIFGYAMCKIVIFIQFLSSASSTLNLCIVTSECFAAVWFPFFWKLLPRKRAILIASCTMAWLVAFIDSILYIPYRTVLSYNDGRQYCIEDWTDPTSIKTFLIINISIISIGPLASITVLNILCIYRLRNTKSQLKPRIRDCKRKSFTRFAIKKIVTISMIFAICRLPIYILNLTSLLDTELNITPKTFLTLTTVCYGLYFFSASTHPILFGLMSVHYKQAIMRNCPCFKPLPRRRTKSTSSKKFLNQFVSSL